MAMSEPDRSPGPNEAATYQIKIQGRLSERWSSWFDGLSISTETAEDGSVLTTITGPVADQSALHGLISRIRDLGLSLVLVERVDR